ncbi:MAG: polymer-forming cytoskeletal protein [Pseudomonadota bacterium]
MLNRNGLFGTGGTRNDNVDLKTKGVGLDAFGTSSSSTRNSSLSDVAATANTTTASRTERDTSAETPVVATKPEEGQGSKLIVGPNIKLKGVEITDCDTLVVEGHVEATMDSRAIQIAQSGSFSGTVGIDVAEIHGTFNGELTVRTKLVIHSTGKVSGIVRYGKLVIEEGGELSGDIKTLTQRPDQPALATAAKNTNAAAQPALHH